MTPFIDEQVFSVIPMSITNVEMDESRECDQSSRLMLACLWFTIDYIQVLQQREALRHESKEFMFKRSIVGHRQGDHTVKDATWNPVGGPRILFKLKRKWINMRSTGEFIWMCMDMDTRSIDWREGLDIRTNWLKSSLDECALNLIIRRENDVFGLLDGCFEIEAKFLQSWHRAKNLVVQVISVDVMRIDSDDMQR